jgi:hypothetical protein
MAGRATMVDSAVSSIPIYAMCSVKMHITNINSTWSMEGVRCRRKRKAPSGLGQGYNP